MAHMSFESRFSESALGLIANIQFLLGWCVLAFFFCSGLLARSVESAKEARLSIQKRFLRLVVPCVVFSVTYRLIRCGLFLTGWFSWESPFPSHISDMLGFIFQPVGPQFYFLYNLFAISVVTLLLDWILPRKYLFWISSIFLMVFYGFFTLPSRAYGPEIELIPLYSFIYILGIACSDKNFRKRWSGVLCFITVGGVALISQNWIVGYVAVPYGLWVIFRQIPWMAKVFSRTYLGKYSSAIYVWHAPIIMPLLSILCVRVLGGTSFVLVPILIGTLLCSIALGEMTSRVRVLRVWRF